MVHRGSLHEGLAIEKFLEPHPRALGHIMQHKGMQGTAVGLRRAFGPFYRWHASAGSGEEQKPYE